MWMGKHVPGVRPHRDSHGSRVGRMSSHCERRNSFVLGFMIQVLCRPLHSRSLHSRGEKGGGTLNAAACRGGERRLGGWLAAWRLPVFQIPGSEFCDSVQFVFGICTYGRCLSARKRCGVDAVCFSQLDSPLGTYLCSLPQSPPAFAVDRFFAGTYSSLNAFHVSGSKPRRHPSPTQVRRKSASSLRGRCHVSTRSRSSGSGSIVCCRHLPEVTTSTCLCLVSLFPARRSRTRIRAPEPHPWV
jgi:hypothetical protein